MNKTAKITALSLILLSGVCVNISANVFTKNQIAKIDCASKKTHLFYYYISDNRAKSITAAEIVCGKKKWIQKIPSWLDAVVPQMMETKKWRDPAEGVLTEAELWQALIAVTYEFLELARKSFTQEDGGAGIPPSFLVKEYSDVKLRYQMALERMYRARLFDSMQGRGRSLIASFTVMSDQLDTILSDLSLGDEDKFAADITSLAAHGENIFLQLLQKPRQLKKLKQVTKFDIILPVLLTAFALIVVFLLVLFYFGKKGQGFQKVFTVFLQRSKKWTEDFNRQFLKVKVEFLILGPIVFFSFLGFMTGNFFGFIFLFVLGVFIGYKTPKFVLDFLKERRGKKIDAQLMDGLILLSNSLKSGMDIVEGFKLVSQDLNPPISEEFGLVIKNYQLGTPFEKALDAMTDRVASRLLNYMIKAIVLQRQVGGNLTKIFTRIVENIREESKLQEKTKALTAQQKIQSIVVAIMPWILAGVMFLFQGAAMVRFYTSGFGVLVLLFCILWLGIGMVLVNKFGKVKV